MADDKKKKTIREYLEELAGLGQASGANVPSAMQMRKKYGFGLSVADIGDDEEDKKKKRGMSYNK